MSDTLLAFRQMMWDTVGYQPYDLQWAMHNSEKPIRMVAGGVRAGKSKAPAMEMLAGMHKPGGVYWIVGPDYEQPRAEFNYIHEALELAGLIAGKPSVPARGACKLETAWGAKLETKTSADVRRLASFAPDFVLMAEAAQQPHDVYVKLLERSLQKRAPLIMSGTFESSLGWYADFYEAHKESANPYIQVFSWPTWANTYEFPLGIDDPGIQMLRDQMPDDLFKERCGAVPVKPTGLVHKPFSPQKHVKRLQWDPEFPVEIAVDPGYSGAYAVLFVQRIKNRLYVLDEVYEREKLGKEVIARCRSRPLWRHVYSGVIDRAANQHHATDSQIEIWEKYAPQVRFRWRMVPEEDGYEVVNLYLKDAADGVPRLLFDDSLDMSRENDGRANGVLGELLSRRFPPYKEGQRERIRPIKANDHACNALGYYLYDWNGPVVQRRRAAKKHIRGYWS